VVHIQERIQDVLVKFNYLVCDIVVLGKVCPPNNQGCTFWQHARGAPFGNMQEFGSTKTLFHCAHKAFSNLTSGALVLGTVFHDEVGVAGSCSCLGE
jgi:hypothetical protein